MYWKRCSKAFLLAAGLSAVGSGCTAIDALVSSRAGVAAKENNGARMAAIGRMFEKQGHYSEAESMYRNALRVEPGNEVVRQRLAYVANQSEIQKTRQGTLQTKDNFALVDSLMARESTDRPTGADTLRPHAREPQVELQEALDQSAVIASLVPVPAENDAAFSEVNADAAASIPEIDTESAGLAEIWAETEIVTEVDVPTEEDVAGRAVIADTPDDKLSQSEFSAQASPEFAFTDDEETGLLDSETEPDTAFVVVPADPQYLPHIVPRGEREDLPEHQYCDVIELPVVNEAATNLPYIAPAGSGEFATPTEVDEVSDTTTRIATLEAVVEWSEHPNKHVDKLILALRNGEDAGVRAIAASSLIECDNSIHRTDRALDHASLSEDEIVRVACLDALIQRGSREDDHAERMLAALSSDDEQIRILAAASLRNLTETRWTRDCVSRLGRLLHDENHDVVAVAATTLSDFGRTASTQHHKLVHLLETTDSERISAATSLALTRIPPDRLTSPDTVDLQPVADEEDDHFEQDEYLPVVE